MGLRPPFPRCLDFMHRWKLVHVGWNPKGATYICTRCGAKMESGQ